MNNSTHDDVDVCQGEYRIIIDARMKRDRHTDRQTDISRWIDIIL